MKYSTKTNAVLSIMLVGLLTIATIPVAMAAVSSLQTDKSIYLRGELVTVTGVATPNSLVGIQITDPLGTAQLTVTDVAESNGDFGRSYRPSGTATLGTWTVTATEGGTTMTTTFSLEPDSQSPVISISVSPSKGTYSSQDMITITVTSNEALQAGPTVRVTQSGGTAMIVTMTGVVSNTWTGEYSIITGQFGTATIRAEGSDLSGNTAVETAFINVAPSGVLTVQAETPTIYYPGDTVRVAALTMLQGIRVDADFNIANILTPTGSQVDIISQATSVVDGVSYFDWDLPANAVAGVYIVHIEADYLGLSGGTIASFEVNTNLPSSSDISSLSSSISSIQSSLNSLSSDVDSGFNDVTSSLGSQISSAQSSISSSVSNAESSINSAVSSAKSDLDSRIGSAQSDIKASITSSENSIKSQITSSQAAVIAAIGNAQSSIETAIDGIRAAATSAVASAISPLSSDISALQSDIASVSDGVSSVTTWIMIVGIIAAITIVLELVILIRKLS